MTPNYHLCDVCGAVVPVDNRMFIATGRSFNGVEPQTDGQYVDLCSTHMRELIRWMLRCKERGLRFPDLEAGKAGKDAITGIDRMLTIEKHGK